MQDNTRPGFGVESFETILFTEDGTPVGTVDSDELAAGFAFMTLTAFDDHDLEVWQETKSGAYTAEFRRASDVSGESSRHPDTPDAIRYAAAGAKAAREAARLSRRGVRRFRR